MNKDILMGMKNGDAVSFRAVVLETQRPLFSFILKYVADEDSAGDLLQETYIRIWQNRKRFDPEQNFMSWALTIAANLCKDYWRKSLKKPASAEDLQLLSSRIMMETDIVNELTNREWAAVIRTLASEMGDKQRTVFVLSCLEGYEHSDIKKITGLNQRQIKSNLYAARQIIKKRLKELGYE